MSRDERVDGQKIAANIISRMKESNRAKIIRAMKIRNPRMAALVESKMYDFNDLVNLSDQGLQTVIKEIDHDTLVVSLKTASDEVKDVLFKNMSERKRRMVQDDFVNLPPTRLSEVQEAQRSILHKIDELRSAGAVRTQDASDVWV